MKAQLEVILEGNIRLPMSCKMDSLKDVAGMGMKIAALARNAKKIMPDIANAGVKSLKVQVSDK